MGGTRGSGGTTGSGPVMMSSGADGPFATVAELEQAIQNLSPADRADHDRAERWNREGIHLTGLVQAKRIGEEAANIINTTVKRTGYTVSSQPIPGSRLTGAGRQEGAYPAVKYGQFSTYETMMRGASALQKAGYTANIRDLPEFKGLLVWKK